MNKYFNLAADFVALPSTWERAIIRLLIFIFLGSLVLEISDMTHLKSIVFMFGYAWRGLSVYGTMRKRS